MKKSLNISTLIIPLLMGYLILGHQGDKEEWVYIFDGEMLNGWEGDTIYWRAEDGKIVGEVTEETLLDNNSFLIWRGGLTSDFEIKVEHRVSSEGNSAINYRSQEFEDLPFALRGYQADLD